MKGADWQPLQIPFAAGVNQRTDDRALQPPELAAAIDVQFDEVGGLQTRKPLVAIGSTTATGTTISTARRMEANGNEQVMFTKDSLYSWNDQLNRWVFHATHLAVATAEQTAFATSGDQYDCDRAELSGIVYYAWTDTSKVYVAVADKATGATIMAPVAIYGVGTRPRLVALSTKVLLFWHAGTDGTPGNILVMAIDPTVADPATLQANLEAAAGTTALAAASCGSYYDATRILTTDSAIFVARRLITTSYEIAKVSNAAAVTALTKARTSDGPISVSSDPTGATVQVIRANGTNIQGDRITVSSLADAATGQAVGTVAGTPVSQIACAHRSVTNGGYYRCYAFWTASEATDSSGWISKFNYVDTNGSIGTQATFVRQLGMGSRAFDYDGSVYVWGVFAGESSFSGASPSKFRAQLQTTYFLYRDDATLHAKCAFQRGGGIAPSVGRLPDVALTSGTTVHSWCATERRIINIGASGEQKGFDARAPRDVTFTFDSNDARRVARLGETMYVTGSEILQYDGAGLYEVGYHVYPWYFGAIEVGAGNLADGIYTFKVTWRWENAKGEIDRSTTATSGEVTIAAGPNGVSIVTWVPLFNTRKTTSTLPTGPVIVEVWRTAVNPSADAPFYLVTSKDPASLTNPNRYVLNDTTAATLVTFNDEFADSTATTKETNPENGDVLENLAPPGAKVIAATETRIFLGAVAGDPDRVWYSKLRTAGLVASFHDALTFDVPKDGGTITGIAFQQGVCVVFRQFATYMFPGDGFDNTGSGQNYGPPQVVAPDVGCRDTDSIAVTPQGIVFQSSKGKYLLTRGWTMQPIGQAVVDYDSETVLAAHVVPAQHQVRFLTGSRMLVWDYLVGAWAEWTIASGVHAAVWQGTYHYLLAAGPLAEATGYTGTSYGMDVETAWIKPADLQGAVGIRHPQVLGACRTTGEVYLRTRVAYDYQATWVDDNYRRVAPAAVDEPLQVLIPIRRRKVEAVKVRLTVYGAATAATKVLDGRVPTNNPAAFWTSTATAIALGNLGNGISLSVGIASGTTAAVEVRDNQTFTTASGLWSDVTGTVGVKVTGSASVPVLMSTIEAAINADSELIDVSASAGTPDLNFTGMAGTTVTISSTAGGAFAAPTGEAIKLTGLGLEVGLTPRLHQRYPRS